MESRNPRKRIVCLAVCVLALVAGRRFYAQSIAPLGQRETEALRAIGDLKERIASAQKTIAETPAQENEAERLQGELKRLQDQLPAGTATIALPALVKDHFAHFGISVPLVRMNTAQDDPDLPGYEHDYWSVALPIDAAGRDITKMLLAVSDLHQQNAFLRVLDFSIRPDPQNPGGRVGSLNVMALVRK